MFDAFDALCFARAGLRTRTPRQNAASLRLFADLLSERSAHIAQLLVSDRGLSPVEAIRDVRRAISAATLYADGATSWLGELGEPTVYLARSPRWESWSRLVRLLLPVLTGGSAVVLARSSASNSLVHELTGVVEEAGFSHRAVVPTAADPSEAGLGLGDLVDVGELPAAAGPVGTERTLVVRNAGAVERTAAAAAALATRGASAFPVRLVAHGNVYAALAQAVVDAVCEVDPAWSLGVDPREDGEAGRRLIEAAVADGARVLCTVSSMPPSQRERLPVTVLADVAPEMDIYAAAAPGPVVLLMPAEELDEVLDLATGSQPYLGGTFRRAVRGPARS